MRLPRFDSAQRSVMRSNGIKTYLHLKRHGICYGITLALLWTLHSHYQIGIGLTDSLPYRFYLAKRDASFKLGDYVVYQFDGYRKMKGFAKDNPHQFFVKQIVGMPGDEVGYFTNMNQSKEMFVAGQFRGTAKASSRTGEPLEVIKTQTIPCGFYYGFADHPDSFDSRYAAMGLIPHSNIVAKVVWSW